MRTLTAVGATLSVLVCGSIASAQTKGSFGQQGEFIFSAERLMPLFSFSSISQDATAGMLPGGVSKISTTTTTTALSFFQGGAFFQGAQPPQESGFTLPRLGFDYVLVPSVTVGGDLIFYSTLGGHVTQEQDMNGGASTTATNPSGSLLAFGIAPRGGYLLPLTDLFTLWLRGGFTFYTETTKTPVGANNTVSESTNQFALDLDPELVITPLPHVGVTVGITTDIPIAGGRSINNDSAGSSVLFFGVEGGLLVWF